MATIGKNKSKPTLMAFVAVFFGSTLAVADGPVSPAECREDQGRAACKPGAARAARWSRKPKAQVSMKWMTQSARTASQRKLDKDFKVVVISRD